MNFSPDALLTALVPLPASEAVVIALSGGMDSVTLAHALCRLRDAERLPFSIKALHIHHGLDIDADAWADFCERFCQVHAIPLRQVQVTIPAAGVEARGGPEDAARRARYRAFADELLAGEVLLLAHHLDDQIETHLLRLMRGAGAAALSGMPRCRPLAAGHLFRPLLQFSREQLHAYASECDLDWVEDSSNRDARFDRNFLRQRVLPLLGERWPNYRDSWSKSLQLLQESGRLASELAAADLSAVATENRAVLSLSQLMDLSAYRRRNVLRFWLEGLGLKGLGWNRLQQLDRQLSASASDSQLRVDGEGYQLRRYRQALWALPAIQEIDRTARLDWDILAGDTLMLPQNGRLIAARGAGGGISAQFATSLQVRYRQGGEACQLLGRPGKSLKKILQEYGMPPWQRDRVPLLYCAEELAAIPGVGVAEKYAASAANPGYIVTWSEMQD